MSKTKWKWVTRYTAMWMTEKGKLKPFMGSGYDREHQIFRDYESKEELLRDIAKHEFNHNAVILECTVKEIDWEEDA